MSTIYMLNLLAKEMGHLIPFPIFLSIGNIRSNEIYSGWLHRSGGTINEIAWEEKNKALLEYAKETKQEEIYWDYGGIVRNNTLISFRSHISPAVDFIFEQLFAWSLIAPLQMHHFGQNYGFFKTMKESIEKDEKNFGKKGIYPTSLPSHCFVPDKTGKYYSEHIYEAGKRKKYHIDFCNSLPEDVEKFVMESPKARMLGITTSVFSPERKIIILAPCPDREYQFSFIISPVWKDPRRM